MDITDGRRFCKECGFRTQVHLPTGWARRRIRCPFCRGAMISWEDEALLGYWAEKSRVRESVKLLEQGRHIIWLVHITRGPLALEPPESFLFDANVSITTPAREFWDADEVHAAIAELPSEVVAGLHYGVGPPFRMKLGRIELEKDWR